MRSVLTRLVDAAFPFLNAPGAEARPGQMAPTQMRELAEALNGANAWLARDAAVDSESKPKEA
jgi:hypothetical protein